MKPAILGIAGPVLTFDEQDLFRRHTPAGVILFARNIEDPEQLADLTADEIEQVVALNLLAPAELCRQVLPGMLARGHGHLVNISSMAGVATFPGLAAYGATKAGLTHLTSGLRADLLVVDDDLVPVRVMRSGEWLA